MSEPLRIRGCSPIGAAIYYGKENIYRRLLSDARINVNGVVTTSGKSGCKFYLAPTKSSMLMLVRPFGPNLSRAVRGYSESSQISVIRDQSENTQRAIRALR